MSIVDLTHIAGLLPTQTKLKIKLIFIMLRFSLQASVMKGHKENVVTDYVLKVLGLEICADTIIGDNMKRGISGGQKKRVTTGTNVELLIVFGLELKCVYNVIWRLCAGEMLVGPLGALFMDNISDGLDSSTTFQIVKCIKQMIHVFDKTAVISLLQPPPETFELFDDVIILGEGRIVYQGTRENVLDFFEFMGFKCPERKGIADYLQEVSSPTTILFLMKHIHYFVFY